MAWPTKWYKWWCADGFDGDSVDFDNFGFFFGYNDWNCYDLGHNNASINANNMIAIGLLYNKCVSLQNQINELEAGVDVTMPAILSAMVGAEYEELQQFIGIVDAYRVALWNEWFNIEYYAALARGFKQ